MKKIACVLVAVCMVLGLAACGVTAGIPAECTIEVGQTVRLSVTPETDNAPKDFEEKLASAGVVWESADPGIAEVDGEGRVTGVSAGETDITVRADVYGLDSVCRVRVTETEPEPEALKLALDGGRGDAMQALILEGIEIPEDLDGESLVWASDDTSVASVDENGIVTPAALGQCTVTVTGMLADGKEWKASVLFEICENMEPDDAKAAPLAVSEEKETDEETGSEEAERSTDKTAGKTSGSKNAASAPAASQTQTGGSGTANSQPSQGNTENAKPAAGACPICGSTDFVNGQCQTIHDYTGYGHCTYDAATGTVYVVCSSCGQSWPRSSFSDPSAFVNGHALACYAQHHKTYITCIQCGASYEEGTEPECLRTTGYCSTACQLASGNYCPVCLSALYIDGCHNCGYGQTPAPEPEPAPDESSSAPVTPPETPAEEQTAPDGMQPAASGT